MLNYQEGIYDYMEYPHLYTGLQDYKPLTKWYAHPSAWDCFVGMLFFFFYGYRLVIKHGQLENPIHIEMSCFLTMCVLCMWNILKWK